ncbi:MAG: 2-C-methyl-D-erythritol 4-phosphate cytidylyltransferase [Bacteroidales bacterium]|nr:2-C-methyl-D-erythritol 4-phosphate cytidylyltransferase [Bacteroidales bacterium]
MKDKDIHNIAIVLAGGTGSRLGCDIPKQFLAIAGKTVIEHTVDVFENNRNIDEIAIVVHPAYIGMMEGIVARNSWTKVKKILEGGKERYNSSLAAIKAYASVDDDINMLFHDAARPMVDDRIINDVISSLEHYSAVTAAVATTDTILEVDAKGDNLVSIPNRKMLRQCQTPQGFKKSVISKAYELGMNDPDFNPTDDCGVVKKYLPTVNIAIVEGADYNIKLTNKKDVSVLEILLTNRDNYCL